VAGNEFHQVISKGDLTLRRVPDSGIKEHSHEAKETEAKVCRYILCMLVCLYGIDIRRGCEIPNLG
jgi:hypothetical protein